MALSLVTQKLSRKYGQRPIPPEESQREGGKLLARHILLDWKGIVDDDGKTEIPYSAELAEEVLTNPEFRKLANAVTWAAQRIADADADENEEKTKNSGAPSAMT